MSLDWSKDEKLELIIDLFKEHPTGLGKRQTWRLLEEILPRNTIDDKIDFLVKRGWMHVEPDDKSWRRGQARRYILTEAYNLYNEFLEQIKRESEKFMNVLNKYLESSKEFDKSFYDLTIYFDKIYSLPRLLKVISTWDSGWIDDKEAMSEILSLWYSSFRELIEIYDRIVSNNIDKINRDMRELRKSIENNHETEIEFFDKLDTEYLNFYKEPEQKLNTLYQDVKVSNDNNKKS
jgi:DNA-dependent RNA polymerase auxiliary subunit epsilon